MRAVLTVILGICLLCPVAWAEEQTPLGNKKAKDSYSLGYEFGANLKKYDVEVDADVLLSAVRDALDNKKSVLTSNEIRDALQQLRHKVVALQNHSIQELAAKTLEEGKTFLAMNKTKEGVKTFPSGLQCKVLKEGSGLSPKATDTVTVHYRGTLTNGTEFDNSYRRGEPAQLRVSGVISGWTEALQLMQAGSTWQIFVPADLAYGQQQVGRIPPNSTLIFEIELLSIDDV